MVTIPAIRATPPTVTPTAIATVWEDEVALDCDSNLQIQ